LEFKLQLVRAADTLKRERQRCLPAGGPGAIVGGGFRQPLRKSHQPQSSHAGIGVLSRLDLTANTQPNHFGFNLTGSSNLVVVVEACTNFASPVWTPVATNTLVNGTSYFSDAPWTNYPARFYRLRAP
jgi:hypothetical protein